MPVAVLRGLDPGGVRRDHAAIGVWALTVPGEILLDRAKPEGFDEAFSAPED